MQYYTIYLQQPNAIFVEDFLFYKAGLSKLYFEIIEKFISIRLRTCSLSSKQDLIDAKFCKEY